MIAFPARLASALDDYRWERDRQVRELEKTTGGWDGDLQHHKDQGGKTPLTLKDWLKSRSPGPGEQAAMAAPPDPNHSYTPDPDAWGGDAPSW